MAKTYYSKVAGIKPVIYCSRTTPEVFFSKLASLQNISGRPEEL